MRTKPRGIHATFETVCHRCNGVLTVTAGRVDRHECEQPGISKFTPNPDLDLEQILTALDNR